MLYKKCYYILNENWKEFNSNYPKIPFKIIKVKITIVKILIIFYSV